MSVRTMAQAKASQKVKEHRDSAEAVVLRRDTGPIVRSTNDGTSSRTTTDTAVNSLAKSYSHYEIVASQNANASTAIQASDVRCEIAVSDLGLDITPTPQDRIVRATGSICTIVSVKTDLHNAWWYLQLRRP